MRVFKIAKPTKVTPPIERPVARIKPTSQEKSDLRKWMLKNPTKGEKLMTELLIACRIKYRPQMILLGYIPDFYIKSRKLIIEVDGLIHDKQKEYDAYRDDVFVRNGYRVWRVTNERLYNDLGGVRDELLSVMGMPKPDAPERTFSRKKTIKPKTAKKKIKRWQDVPKLTKTNEPSKPVSSRQKVRNRREAKRIVREAYQRAAIRGAHIVKNVPLNVYHPDRIDSQLDAMMDYAIDNDRS